MLGWINTKAVVDLRESFAAIGQAAVRLSPVLHNQAGTAVSWALIHLDAPTESDPGERSRRVMWELARRQWVVRNVVTEARHGDRRFEAIGNLIRLPFVGDADLDGLDRLLDLMTEIRGLDVEGRPSLAQLDRLVQNATLMGANAVISMRFDSSELANTMSEIVAYGTAVVVVPDAGAVAPTIE